jgi:iron complex outermembrane receptor protein
MKYTVLLTIFAVLCFFCPVSLHAQEEEVTLDEVVVTATRDLEEVRRVPANVTVIKREEIERSYAQTVVDLFRDKVGVVVRDIYGNGKNVAVDIREFGEGAPQNVLVLVNGRRVNEIDLSGVDWSQIPLDQIERIEIVRGPGSVLYGDNAVGGVINIITKKPTKPLSFQAGITLGSYRFNKENGSLSGSWGPIGAILDFGYSATDGYRDNGFLRTKDIAGTITYNLNEDIALSLVGGFHRDKQGLPGGLPEDLYDLDRRATIAPDDEAETDDGYLDLSIKARFGNLGGFEADLIYREREVEDFFTSYSFEDQRNLTTWGFTPRYILDRPLAHFTNKLILGVDAYRWDSRVDSESTFLGTTSYNQLEVEKKSIGPYVLDEFSILDNLILSLGYRYEWVTYDLFQESPRGEDTLRDGEYAWSIGMNYLFGKRSSAYLSVKRSFRFPASDELIQFFPTFQVNPSIEPQTGYNYEAGIRHAFNDWIEGNLTFFWADILDEIFFNPETFTNENYPKTRRVGLEVGARVKPLPWVSLWGNYGYTRPTLRGGAFSGNDIPGVPRNKGALGTDIDVGKGFMINVRLNAVGSRYYISDWANQVDKLDCYYTLDARASYSWKGLNLFFGVNNITNQKYEEYGVTNGTGTIKLLYASPERNVMGGISYVF